MQNKNGKFKKKERKSDKPAENQYKWKRRSEVEHKRSRIQCRVVDERIQFFYKERLKRREMLHRRPRLPLLPDCSEASISLNSWVVIPA